MPAAAPGEAHDECAARVLYERGYTLDAIRNLYATGQLRWTR